MLWVQSSMVNCQHLAKVFSPPARHWFKKKPATQRGFEKETEEDHDQGVGWTPVWKLLERMMLQKWASKDGGQFLKMGDNQDTEKPEHRTVHWKAATRCSDVRKPSLQTETGSGGRPLVGDPGVTSGRASWKPPLEGQLGWAAPFSSFKKQCLLPTDSDSESDFYIIGQTDERMGQKVKDLRPRNSKEYILNNFEKR